MADDVQRVGGVFVYTLPVRGISLERSICIDNVLSQAASP